MDNDKKPRSRQDIARFIYRNLTDKNTHTALRIKQKRIEDLLQEYADSQHPDNKLREIHEYVKRAKDELDITFNHTVKLNGCDPMPTVSNWRELGLEPHGLGSFILGYIEKLANRIAELESKE